MKENMELTTTDEQFDYASLRVSSSDVEFLKGKAFSINARTANTIIENGKDFIEAKERVGSGEFERWVKGNFPWDIRTVQNMMLVTKRTGNENFSELVKNVTKSIAYKYAPDTVPDSAIDEANEKIKNGEKVGVKESSEIIKKHKDLMEEITRLKEENTRLKTDGTKVEPNLDNLIPAIKGMIEDKEVTPAMGRHISTMTPDGQTAWLTYANNVFSLRNQLSEKDAKIKDLEHKKNSALQDALDAIKEKELAMQQLEEATGADESALMLKHKKELKTLREDYLDRLREEKKAADKEASELHEKLNKEKVAKAEKDRDKAKREEQKAKEDYNAIAEKEFHLECKIKELEAQLKVKDPATIDAAHASALKDIYESLKNRLLRFEEDRKRYDYPMNQAWEVINRTISDLSEYQGKTEGVVHIEG
jgi:DNA repair exonuclease SbcCD ATPase subunit